MAAKNTSGSSFHFIFVFYAPQLGQKYHKSEKIYSDTFWDILSQSLQTSKIMQMSCMQSALKFLWLFVPNVAPHRCADN